MQQNTTTTHNGSPAPRLGQLSGATIITGGNTNVQIIHTSFNVPGSEPLSLQGLAGGNSQNRNSFSNILNNIMRFTGSMGMDEEERRPTSTQFIQDLPRITVTQEILKEMTSSTKQCTICQEEYKEEEKLIELPCKHSFHEECLVPWLNMHNSCPTCRHA